MRNSSRGRYTRCSCGRRSLRAKATTIRLDLVRLEDLAASHILDELDVTLHDRNSTGELNFNLSGLVIDRAGRYELALHANDRLVGTKSIDVIQSLGDRA